MCTIQNTCHLWKVHFSSVLIWYFYIHCILDLFASDAQGSICEICLTDLVSFLGFLDSLWIYLFRIPYGSTCSIYGHIDLFALCDSEISILRGGTLHYTSLLNQAPHPKGSTGVVCRLGVFSVRGGNNGSNSNNKKKVIFHLWKLGIHLSSLILPYCYSLLWHLLSI